MESGAVMYTRSILMAGILYLFTALVNGLKMKTGTAHQQQSK